MTKNQNTNSGSREIPIKEVSGFSLSDDELLHQRIAEKAHELYECRGCCYGRDLDDWLEAERLVLAETEVRTEKTVRKPRSRLGEQKKS
jgi:hypothetical protein